MALPLIIGWQSDVKLNTLRSLHEKMYFTHQYPQQYVSANNDIFFRINLSVLNHNQKLYSESLSSGQKVTACIDNT